jgi:salicylate hydroxylase
MRNQLFHIAGGGIAGLASALAVAKSGNSACLMEKAEKFEMVGAGLQLGPNAVRALQKLDAWDAVEPITSSPHEIMIRDGKTGKLLRRLVLGKKFENRFGAPYRVAHRADLLQALLNVAQSKPTISITTNAAFIAREQFEGHALIAADGVWSKMREALFPGHEAVISKDVIFRSLSEPTNRASHTSAGAPLVPSLRWDDTDLSANVILWLYPGGHVVHYQVANKLNLVAVTRGTAPEKHFAQACDDLQSILANRDWSKWMAASLPPLKQWHSKNITLIGDAAHGTLPYLAQGAAMALEDAATLFELLSAEQKCESAFKKLGVLRCSRTRQIHHASLRSGKIYHATGFLAQARDFAISIMPSHLQDLQMAWIYDGT